MLSVIAVSNIQASNNFSKNLKSTAAVRTHFINKEEPKLTSREMRLCLFDLNKFDDSFNLERNTLISMKDRNRVWKKFQTEPGYRKIIQDEFFKHVPTQNKIFDYIPQYLIKILDVESTGDLKIKNEYFSDFTNLMNTLHQNSNDSRQIKKLEQKLIDIDFDQYPLSAIFLRHLASKKDDIIYAHYPSFIQQKINKICLDDQLNKPYLYHKSLEENCKMDQDWLERTADFNTLSTENSKKLIDFYNQNISSDYH